MILLCFFDLRLRCSDDAPAEELTDLLSSLLLGTAFLAEQRIVEKLHVDVDSDKLRRAHVLLGPTRQRRVRNAVLTKDEVIDARMTDGLGRAKTLVGAAIGPWGGGGVS